MTSRDRALRVMCELAAACAASTVFLLCTTASSASAQTPSTPPDPQPAPTYKESVRVVGATPIHGLGIDRDKVPSNLQTATADDLSRTPGIHVGEQLTASFASVHVNETQSNAFQPDIQFRGFSASPLLGLSQGVAVYQDGVRLNEPFGDTVHWDLLPTNAIATVSMIPGSNPLFGLNALGGAVSIETKTGFSHPGHTARVFGGSFGRRWAEAESGGHTDRLSYFVTGRLLAEDGWRDFSTSRIRQLFGTVEWRGTASSVTASATAAGNRMIGNGPAPVQLLEEDRAAIFTHPDQTETRLGMVTVRGRHTLSPFVNVAGVLFYRPSTIRTFNGDDTAYDECEDEALEGLLCSEEGGGEPVEDQFGQLVGANEDDPFTGTNNTSRTRTHGWGGGVQATVVRPVADRPNHFVMGLTLDGARSRYESDTELARLSPDRGTIGSGLLDAEAAVRLRTRVRHSSVYLADFFTVAPGLTLMGSARYNYSTVRLRDRIGDDLTGDHTFSRVNPGVGATYTVRNGLSVFGSVNAASRVPTPSELSCADPDDPCRLPNAFVSDPPLDQVVARTWEGGVRGNAGTINWAAAAFRTTNRDDIIFISSGALTNEGHFENVGDTLRRGLELSAFGSIGEGIRWTAGYTYLRATFDTPYVVTSPNHPDAAGGEIAIERGASIPSVPRHNLKADLSVTAGRLGFGAGVGRTSSQYLRGDEANRLDPIDGVSLVHLNASVALHPRARIVGRVTNLFGREYETFGVLGEADDVLGDEFDDPRFVSPGAPRAAWIGLEVSFR